MFLFANGLLKVLKCSNHDRKYVIETSPKAKFRLLRHNDWCQLGFQNREKVENSDFTEIFSFSISNIFVELLVTHIKLYIYS